MPILASLMIALIGLVMLSGFVGLSGLPVQDYEKMAKQKALSAYHVTGAVPASAVVIGRTIDLPAGTVSVSRQRKAAIDVLEWRKAMVEQVIVNTCITLSNKCGKKDRTLLWAFMPANQGLVSDLLVGGSAGALDCATATSVEYAQYARYIMNGALDATLLATINFEGTSLNYYYSKPSTGEGCSYNDLVDLR